MAQAESINADTAMRFNDYVAAVTRESARIPRGSKRPAARKEPIALQCATAAAP